MDQYLALERDSEVKYEYWNGEVYAMSGGSLAHDQIMGNVDRAIAKQLEGRPCFVFTNNMQIKVPAAPPYRYADGSVVCGNVEVEEFNGNDLLVNPLVIWKCFLHRQKPLIEVTSLPTTSRLCHSKNTSS